MKMIHEKEKKRRKKQACTGFMIIFNHKVIPGAVRLSLYKC